VQRPKVRLIADLQDSNEARIEGDANAAASD
jgi:hypothetical protein